MKSKKKEFKQSFLVKIDELSNLALKIKNATDKLKKQSVTNVERLQVCMKQSIVN